MEQFNSTLQELAENCDFENREEAIIRDIFITDKEIGHQNQQKIWSNNNGVYDSSIQ